MKIQTLWGEETIQSKTCIKCKEDKPITEFGIRNNKEERRNDCKACQYQVTREVKLLEKNHPCPDDEYQCPICNRKEKDLNHLFRDRRVWVLDHDHETKEFRGWICNPCNTGLSRFGDSVETLERAIEYVKNGGVER